MNSRDLRERYVYAAARGLPRNVQADVERELNTLIDDLMEARCAGRGPTDKDLRVVLTELGTPAELRRKYNPDAGRALIGPDYFPQYRLTMGVVAAALVGGLALAHLLMVALQESAWPDALGDWLYGTLTGLACAFTVVTLLFAVFERRGVRLDMPSDTLENLPPVPRRSEIIPRWESVTGLALCVLFLVLFLAFPQGICVVLDRGGELQRYALFDVAALRAQWLWIALFGVAGLARETFRLIEGKYSLRALAVTAACDLASIPLACLFLLRDGLVNPDFLQALGRVVPDLPEAARGIFASFPLVLLAVILAVLLLDLGSTALRTLRARRAV